MRIFPARLRRAAVVAALLALPLASASFGGAVKPAVAAKARPLPLSDVRLTGGPLKAAQEQDARYLLSLDIDRMVAFLRTAAGLPAKAQGYGGWDGADRQLTGHIAGHYLSGVSLMWAATGDSRFKERADRLVEELKAVQDAQGDGYIGAQADRAKTPGKTLYAQLAAGDIRSAGFDLNGMWSPWYVQHKIFAGLRDAWRWTGSRTALDVEVRFAGWAASVLAKLDDAQIQKMLGTEFGGMNEVLIDLAEDTGEVRWLALADKFRHRAVVEPLARGEDILRGKHGNTLVPKVIGTLSRYILAGDDADGRAARFFWDRVALHHSFATGGHGRNEYFGEADVLAPMVEGRTAETCNVYNMIKMSRTLFGLEPEIKYAEFHERALFNHILGSMDPADGSTCYMVPVGQAVSREYQAMQKSFTCCVGSGMESHALHADGIYYESGDTLWVNLFAPSAAEWKAGGVRLTMETSFPEGGALTLRVDPAAPRAFAVALRRPSWAGTGYSVKVNGEPVRDLPPAGAYVIIRRTWTAGDRIEAAMPMSLRLERLPDDPERAAVLRGPIVLAGDLGPLSASLPRDDEGALLPQAEAKIPASPVLVTGETDLAKWIRPAAGKPGVYRTAGVGRDRDVDLVPFYRLHRNLYTVYWTLLTPARYAERAAALKAADAAAAALRAATVSFVQPGQMQSERDFAMQGGRTFPIQLQNRFGRRAADWFSFDLPVEAAGVQKLLVTFGNDERADRRFAVLVNGVKVGEQAIARRSPQEKEAFFDAAFDLPPAVLSGRSKVTVRFEGIGGSETGSVFGIRIVRAVTK